MATERNEYVDAAAIRNFEQSQKQFGTKTALHNFAFNIVTDILRGVGVTKTSVVTK